MNWNHLMVDESQQDLGWEIKGIAWGTSQKESIVKVREGSARNLQLNCKIWNDYDPKIYFIGTFLGWLKIPTPKNEVTCSLSEGAAKGETWCKVPARAKTSADVGCFVPAWQGKAFVFTRLVFRMQILFTQSQLIGTSHWLFDVKTAQSNRETV